MFHLGLSSVLAWRIPGTGEPGGLPSMALQSRTQLKWLSSSSSVWVASASYNWSRSGVRRGKKKKAYTDFSASDFQVRPVLPTSQCFQAYQKRKLIFMASLEFLFNTSTRVYFSMRFSGLCKSIFVLGVSAGLHDGVYTELGGGILSRRKKEVSIPHLLPPGDMACG